MAARADATTEAATAGGHTHETVHETTKHDSDINLEEAWGANVKRTYDEHQTYDHDSRVRSRADWEDQRQMRMRHAEELHTVRMQLFQNAVETANMASKQALRDAELASDRKWNVDEVAAVTAVVLDRLVDMAKTNSGDE